ncbi:hypothetical protein JCM8097_007563 [Rhodosporidiobolus ruineniae]
MFAQSSSRTLLRRSLAGASRPPPPIPLPLLAHSRAFSLWPTSSASPAPSPEAPPLPPAPVKPTLTDLFGPTSLPDPTFFEPLSAVFLSLPPSLSLSYATFIPLFTLFYRSTTTLPVTLWQRRRTRRFTDVVLPLVKREQGRIALETRDECRRAGKSYEEYQQVFQKRAREAAHALARRYRCSPRLTLILPPLIHIPIFITATLALRDACTRALSALSISPDALPALLSAEGSSMSSLLTPEALAHLHELSSTPLLWCPSLVLPDPTMFLPLSVGLAALLNVEVTARTRRAVVEGAARVGEVDGPERAAKGAATGGGGGGGAAQGGTGGMQPLSAAEKRRIVARRALAGAQPIARQLSTSPPSLLPPSPRLSAGPAKGTTSVDVGAGLRGARQQRIVTNVLRVAAVAFIPVAGMAPAAVCAYWLTSNLFTLVQNLALCYPTRSMDDSRTLPDLLLAPSAAQEAGKALIARSSTLAYDGEEDDRPEAIDLSHHLSELAKARLGSPLKGLYKYFQKPGMLMFAGGLPPPDYFPYESLTATSLSRNAFKASQPSFGAWLLSFLPPYGQAAKKTDEWSVNKYETDPLKVQLSSALQYGTATGLPALAAFLRTFTARVYRPAYKNYACLVNAGSTDAWSKIVTTLCDPGDGVLAEEWTYPSALATAWPYGIKPVPLPMDGEGMTPEGLDELLGGWNAEERGGMRRPRVLYTIPVAQNPTGATMSLERKKKIYALAVKYDVIIVEDDPYYFLQTPPFVPSPSAAAAGPQRDDKTPTDDEFLAALVPSYLSIDTEGRVVRIDTFSKTIAPGSRLGWTTCNPLFAERLERANESSTQGGSGFSQALIAKLLAEEWGLEGYLRWLKGIRSEYRLRRDALVNALIHTADAGLETRPRFSLSSSSAPQFELWTTDARERDEKGFLVPAAEGKKGEGEKVLSFVAPDGGMFVWLRVHLSAHPRYHSTPARELLQTLWESLAQSNLLVAPGTMFDAAAFGAPSEEAIVTQEGDGFFRLSFSSAPEAHMKEAAGILKKVVAEFFRA